MKKTFILTLFMMLCSFTFGQAWEYPYSDNEDFAMVVAKLSDATNAATTQVGAFVGDDLRGNAYVEEDGFIYMNVYAGVGETVNFRLRDTNTGVVTNTGTYITITTNDEQFSDFENPVQIAAAVVKIGNQYYNTLASAIAAANAGDKIQLLADINESVTINKNLKFDGKKGESDTERYSYTGTMNMKGAGIFVENVNFVKGAIDAYSKVDNANNNCGNKAVTVKNCDFKGESYNGYAVNLRSANSINIENVTVENYGYGFVQLGTGSTGFKVNNVTVKNCNYGVKMDTGSEMSLVGFSTEQVVFPIYVQAGSARTINMTNCSITETKDHPQVPGASLSTFGSGSQITFNFYGNNVISDKISDTSDDNLLLQLCGTTAEGTTTFATLTAPGGLDVKTTESIINNGYIVDYIDGVYQVIPGKVLNASTGKRYASLSDALEAAQAGDELVVLQNIELTETVTINADKTVVLNLNGKTISMVYAENATDNHTMINNLGDLTIKSSVEGGKLSYTYTGEDLGTTYAANTITSEPGSVLTVKSGTIENLTFDSGIIAYAIDGRTNGGAGDVTVNIEGGVITSKRQALRIFANSTTKTGALNISGGEFTGRVIVQNASAKANKAALNITGGTFNANDYKSDVLYVGGSDSATIEIQASVSGGTFMGDITETNVKGFISGGTFKSTTDTTLLADGFMFGAVSGGYCEVVLEAGIAGFGTWGGIDWTLTYGGTLTIAPTAGEPVPDPNAPTKRTYKVGEWRERVIYKSNGSASAIGGAPYNMNAVKQLIIEEGVTKIGSFTAQFPYLTGEVVIPSTVTYIGQEAFYAGSTNTTQNINKLTFTAGGTSHLCIANGAFKSVEITEVSFPGDREYIHIHHWAFGGSPNLEHAYIPANVTKSWGGEHVDYFDNFNSQSNVTWAQYGSIFTGCTKMKTITFEDMDVRDLFFANGRQSTNDDYIVAAAGLVAYNTIENAIAAAKDDDDVVLYKNLTLSDTWTIPAGMSLTLNLNGKTLSQTKACTASYEMINNKGNLTITGNGKLSFKDTSAGDPTFGWGSYTVRNEGNLVVENGTIEHKGAQAFATHMICAIFQYSGSTTINGGTISTPNYRSARLWKGDMTINGGTFDGQVWVQAVDNTAELTINGGTFEPNGQDASAVFVTNNQYDAALAVTGGTFNGKIGCSDATKLAGAISGGMFNETAMNGTNGTLLKAGFIFSEEADENGYYTLVDDPSTHYIYTIEDLVAFRDDVNGVNGVNKYYEGVNVYLAADIDMAGVNWVGIGSATADHGFMGNFDGQGYTIKNLTITNPTLDSDGYAYAGLFAVTEGTDKDHQNTIKNLTIENVTITTTGHIVSAAIAYPYYTIVDNVKVCGDIKIEGGDYTSGVLAYTRRCVNASNLSIVGNSNSFVKGNITVGGVISDIQMNGGLIADYENFRAEGLTITGTKSVGGISGIIGAQTLNGATVKNVTLNCSDARVGVVSGSMGGVSTISNVFAENVTDATAVIGATYDNAKAIEARIGDTYYATFNNAYTAAEVGKTITVLNPVVITENNKSYNLTDINVEGDVYPMFRIQNGATVTFDGGNFTNGDYIFTLGEGATESATSGNLVINGGKYHGETTVANVVKGLLTINGGEFSISDVDTYDYAYVINCYDDSYNAEQRLANVSITGGTFYNFNPENNAAEGAGTDFCAAGYGAIQTADNSNFWVVVPVQEMSLIKGWNWISHYVSAYNALDQIQEGLGDNGEQIKAQTDNRFSLYLNGTWINNNGFENTSVTEMYMVKTTAAVEAIELKGVINNEVEIALQNGWNWIGYPVNNDGINLDEAFPFTPQQKDYVKGQTGFAQYSTTDNKWHGSLKRLEAGKGYMYKNQRNEIVEFVYNTPSRAAKEANITSENNYWSVEASQYATNMSMVATLNVNGKMMEDNFEVAAFVNGEVRGSARPIYIESLDAYMLFLTIYGQDAEEVTFKYVNLTTEEEYVLNERINYNDNAVIGSIEEAYALSYGVLSIGENGANVMNIYPNPTTTNTAINFASVCDMVEVYNSLGVKVAEYRNVDSIDGMETAGIYVIRVTNGETVQNCRLVVK